MSVPWIVVASADSNEEAHFLDELMNTQKNNCVSRLDETVDNTEVSKEEPAIELRSYTERPVSAVENDLENHVGKDLDSKFVNAGSKILSQTTMSPQTEDIDINPTVLREKKADSNYLSPIPRNVPFMSLTPKPVRRTISANELIPPASPSPNTKRPGSSASGRMNFDSISAIDVQVGNYEMTKQEKTQTLRHILSKLLSSVYATFVIVIGVVLYVSNQQEEKKFITEIFSSLLAGIGLIWLVILHVDIWRYKKEVLKQLKEREDAMQDAIERFSNATEFIFNSGYDIVAAATDSRNNSEDAGKPPKVPPYRYLIGRHSGSFYLKIGMAAFCFGYLIYEGLQLVQHILNFMDDEKKMLKCSRTSSIVLHIILPIYAFYQLFITFKYSNIVINRYKGLARFGLMHLIAACLCFWFSTIVEEAVEDYNHRSFNLTNNATEFVIASFRIKVQKRNQFHNLYQCNAADSVLSTRSLRAIPYLYPFAIEYNIILAGVWYIVWQNIGQVHQPSDPHHIRHTISQDESGGGEIAYQSNLVINADCHASNKGLFTGLFVLLATIVTVIVFFVAMTTDGYQQQAVSIHTGQEGILTFVGLLSVIVSTVQINKLDISKHPITFLDDVLMFVPLPFFFLHGILSSVAEYKFENYTRLAVHILVTFQVVIQTTFVKDGLRRCSNSQALKYKKPGREIITFLIILNITLWIVNTFELKSVEGYHAQEEYFGDFIWMFIGHTTLPLMLFYRFHSSVCLADMWKSAYEKEA